ncbi:asparagine synthase C-terminal domain-containing protein [Streptomyces sp. M10(2022)]
MLSGGLDSSAITALAAAHSPRGLRSFSVDFEGAEEDFRATALRPERDTPSPWPLPPTWASTTPRSRSTPLPCPASYLRRCSPATSRASASSTPPCICSSRRSGSSPRWPCPARRPTRCSAATLVLRPRHRLGRHLSLARQRPRLTSCLAPDVRARIRPDDDERDRYATLRARVPRLAGESGLQARMREVLYLSLQGPLLYLLDRKDRMSMAVGLEVRVPFCDHQLLEYVWNVPWKMKVADGREKSLLRAAVADLLPQGVLQRRKSAYPRPSRRPTPRPYGPPSTPSSTTANRRSPGCSTCPRCGNLPRTAAR